MEVFFFCPFEAGLICIGISVLSEIPWISSSHEAFGMIYGGSQTAMSENSRNMCPKYHVFFRREVMKWRRSLAWELEGVAIPSIEKLPLGLVVGIMATNIFHTPFEKTQSHESPPKKQQQKKHCSQKPKHHFRWEQNITSPLCLDWTPTLLKKTWSSQGTPTEMKPPWGPGHIFPFSEALLNPSAGVGCGG